LVNRSPRYIAAWRQRKGNGDVLVLPFFTGPVEDLPSFRRVRARWIARPTYVGNFSDPRAAIKEFVRAMALGPVSFILDESLAAT